MKKTSAQEAIKELTMALMYLSRFHEGRGFYKSTDYFAWKGYDFDTLNCLEDEDYIYQGSHPSRTKKIFLTESGISYAEEILKKYNIEDWNKGGHA